MLVDGQLVGRFLDLLDQVDDTSSWSTGPLLASSVNGLARDLRRRRRFGRGFDFGQGYRRSSCEAGIGHVAGLPARMRPRDAWPAAIIPARTSSHCAIIPRQSCARPRTLPTRRTADQRAAERTKTARRSLAGCCDVQLRSAPSCASGRRAAVVLVGQITSYRSVEIVIWSSSKSPSQVRSLRTASANSGRISPSGTDTVSLAVLGFADRGAGVALGTVVHSQLASSHGTLPYVKDLGNRSARISCVDDSLARGRMHAMLSTPALAPSSIGKSECCGFDPILRQLPFFLADVVAAVKPRQPVVRAVRVCWVNWGKIRRFGCLRDP